MRSRCESSLRLRTKAASAVNHCEDFIFTHQQQLIVADLEGLTGIAVELDMGDMGASITRCFHCFQGGLEIAAVAQVVAMNMWWMGQPKFSSNIYERINNGSR